MGPRVQNVVILGGGTAGWMTATYLAKSFGELVQFTVLEAPSIPRIGVGEATVPNMQRVFFDHLGIPEDEWMRECGASLKMAVKFVNWRTEGEGTPVARELAGRPDHFYHPFGILPQHNDLPLSHYWADRHLNGVTITPYDYSCFVEPPLMDAKLSSRFKDGTRATVYAWHFDAQLVANFLRDFAITKQSVNYVRDKMVDVLRDERGFITALRTESGNLIEGDLFIDCSGFRGALINKVMGEPFLDQSDHLLCDSAVAGPVPHDGSEEGIEPYTSAIAMKSGWLWKTPMLSRFGTGYVYASNFVSRDQATLDFCRVWGLDPESDFNHIRFRVGRNRRSWVKNCVSIGLASCFLEPLESTGLYMTYAAVYQLAKHFPDRSCDPALADSFNRAIADMFDESRDFLQAHFFFSPRTDTPFWRANKELTLAAGIREKVDMYKAGLTVNAPAVGEGTYYTNFDVEFRNFWTNGSYYCIFAGLGMTPDRTAPGIVYEPETQRMAEDLFEDVRQRQARYLNELPTLHEYLSRLHGAEATG